MVQLNIFISSLQLLSVHKNGQMPCNAVLKDIHFNICTGFLLLWIIPLQWELSSLFFTSVLCVAHITILLELYSIIIII